MRSRHLEWTLILAFLAPWASSRADTTLSVDVTHVSSEHAYIDAGTANGLAVGDTLEVRRNGEPIGVAITVFVATHSAACRPFSGPPIAAGDTLVAHLAEDTDDGPETTAPATPPAPTTPVELQDRKGDAWGSRSSLGDVHGSLSMQWYHSRIGEGDARAEVDEPTARLTLGAKRLFGQNMDARVRLRVRRHDDSTVRGKDMVWQDRLYELTISYASTGGATSLQMGRLAPRGVSGFGYVDGVTFSQAVSERTRIGLVGGRRVSWAIDADDPIIEKYGLFVESRREGLTRLNGTVAAVAEYEAGNINREYVSARGGLRRGILDVNQLAEIDVNRGWRNERAGTRFTLARVRSSMRVRPSRAIRMNVTYDSTERTWTALNRSVPDSLFDDALRRGFRASTDVEPVAGWALHLGGGVRGREGESKSTRSWEAGLNARRLPIDRLGLSVRATGFEGALARGIRPEARMDLRFDGGHRIELAVGRYRYETDFSAGTRENDWISAETYLRLSSFSVRTSVELDGGDDAPGQRVFSEIAYHF